MISKSYCVLQISKHDIGNAIDESKGMPGKIEQITDWYPTFGVTSKSEKSQMCHWMQFKVYII